MSEEHRNEPRFFPLIWKAELQTLRSLLSRVCIHRVIQYMPSNLLSCENTQCSPLALNKIKQTKIKDHISSSHHHIQCSASFACQFLKQFRLNISSLPSGKPIKHSIKLTNIICQMVSFVWNCLNNFCFCQTDCNWMSYPQSASINRPFLFENENCF